MKDKNYLIEMDISSYGFTSSEVVPSETFVFSIFSSSYEEKQISVLSGAVLSLLEPLRRSTEKRFVISLKNENVLRCLSRNVSYCDDIPEREKYSPVDIELENFTSA